MSQGNVLLFTRGSSEETELKVKAIGNLGYATDFIFNTFHTGARVDQYVGFFSLKP